MKESTAEISAVLFILVPHKCFLNILVENKQK